jgi:hypothetical protein
MMGNEENNTVSRPWQKSTIEGDGSTEFNATTTDSAGNIYAVATQLEDGNCNYGSGNVAGSSSGYNAVIVKYDSAGNCLWAKSTIAGADNSEFLGVAADSEGNIYAVGVQRGSKNCNYSSGNVAGSSSGDNAVIVKYDSEGNCLWAKSTTVGTSESVFTGVATDGAGNIYAVGTQEGGEDYNYGSGNVAGGSYRQNNAVIVKYDSAGNCLWSKSTTAGTGMSEFSGVVTDTAGNIYVVGYQTENENYNYGSGNVAGSASGYNAVIVKYDSAGNCLWAKSTTAGTGMSEFSGVTADSAGNIYAIGKQQGSGNYNYGSGNVAGSSSFDNDNAVIVKYDSNGTCLWAKSTIAGADNSEFLGVATDSEGIYAVGSQSEGENYNYGEWDVADSDSDDNAVIVKYDSAGNCLWAKSTIAGVCNSEFLGVAADSEGNIYAVGVQYGSGKYNYGSGNVSGSSSGSNAVIVKYIGE